jgi:alpha-glucosidase
MKKIRVLAPFLLLLTGSFLLTLQAMGEEVYSPDRNMHVRIIFSEKIYYQVSYNKTIVLQASPLSITVNNKTLGYLPKLKGSSAQSVNKSITTVWGSRKEIRDVYNELTLEFEGNFSVKFRVYNNGMAYRFETRLKEKEVYVQGEEVAYRFNFGTTAWMLDGQSYESNYRNVSLDAASITNFNNSKDKIFLPLVVQSTPGIKVAITEADLRDYPSLFLKRGNDYENFLAGTFEKYALTVKPGMFSNYAMVADKEAGYLAATSGTREYPWRVLIVSERDETFADCDLVYQLSKPSAIPETGWIKPGKVAWDWWHDYTVEGKDFKGGINTATYRYQVDFAAKYNLEYIMVDWLWTDKYDLALVNPEVDIKQIIEYAKSKGVRVILWCPGHTLHAQLDKALDLFAGFGAAGVKADFFGREDQTGIRMYEEIAQAAAKRKLLVDFHGCTKPTGLSRTYPNIINYEAVLGNEYNKLEDKVTATHKAILPFTRSLQGPMDFTPGGMRNNVNALHPIFFTLPMVRGTRCNEMALFVLYNEPLKMLADAPHVYESDTVVTRFLSKVPTTWDDSKVVSGKMGEYILTVRKWGNTWYGAAITNEASRELTLDCSFLGEGTYTATIFSDGINADKVGADYAVKEESLNRNKIIKLRLEKSGGTIFRIEEKR